MWHNTKELTNERKILTGLIFNLFLVSGPVGLCASRFMEDPQIGEDLGQGRAAQRLWKHETDLIALCVGRGRTKVFHQIDRRGDHGVVDCVGTI